MFEKLFSKKSTKIEFTDKIKLDDWMIKKVNSAKVLTLAELEEL